MKKIFENIENIAVSIVVISIITMFFFRIVEISGASMENTLHDGDKAIITNFFYKPKVGDIIGIDENTYFEKPIIKRIIAVEGDTVFINYSTGDVYVNDELLQENYIKEKIEITNLPNLEMKVPENHIFVLGDNRNHSGDSRLLEVGAIHEKYILGKAVFVLFPFSNFGGL